jgi:hypothetical protein
LENNWYVSDIDIIFNSNINWQYDPAFPSQTQYDFESVALHELGHAHQLGHIIDNNGVMHYAISNGQTKRNLSPFSDIAGGNYVMDKSSRFIACSPSHTPMLYLNSSNCALGPLSEFTANPNNLCPNENAVISLSSTPNINATYFWNFGPGAAPATANTSGPHSVSWNSVGIKTITLNVSKNGCISNSQTLITVNNSGICMLCPVPTGIEVSSITINSAKISWQSASEANLYEIIYRAENEECNKLPREVRN